MLSPEGKYGGEEKHRKQRSPGSSGAPSPAPGRGMQQGSRSASYSSLLLGPQQEKWSRPRLLKVCFFTFLAVVGLVNTLWVAKSFVSAWQNNGLAGPAPQLNSTTLTVKVSQVGGDAAAARGQPYLIQASLSDDSQRTPAERLEVSADSGSAESLIQQLHGVGSALGGAFKSVADLGGAAAAGGGGHALSTGSRRDPVKAAEPKAVPLIIDALPAGSSSSSSSTAASAALPASSSANDTAAAAEGAKEPDPPAPHRAELTPPEVDAQSGDACAQALGAPKVALLFLTQGDLWHEPTWKFWFRSAAGVLPASAVRSSVCGAEEGLLRDLRQACLPSRDQGDSAPIDQQHLFSVYIHAPPETKDEDLNPLFRGRLIPNRIKTEWGTHSLVEATRNLLWEAFKDPRNTRFVLMSESDIPLYSPLTFYQQLMAEERSRVNSCPGGHTMPWRWSWRMGTDALKVWHWRKSAQWFSMRREHVEAVLRDVEVYRKFEEHCYHGWDGDYKRWRDCFSDEHYIPTLLAMKDLSDQTECSGYGVSFTDWSGGGAHPKAYAPEEVTPHLIANVTRQAPDLCNSDAAHREAQQLFINSSHALGAGFQGTCMEELATPAEYRSQLPGNCSLTSRKFTKPTVSAVSALFSNCENGLNLLSSNVCAALGKNARAEDRYESRFSLG